MPAKDVLVALARFPQEARKELSSISNSPPGGFICIDMYPDAFRKALAGAAFGAALTASQCHLPSVIIDQFVFKDMRMLQVILTAMASSAFVMVAIEKADFVKRSVRPASSLGLFSAYDGNILGGSLIGIGMRLSGSCPGTVLPQLAQAMPSAIPTAMGCVLGGMAYARMPPKSAAVRNGDPTKSMLRQTLPETLSYLTFGGLLATLFLYDYTHSSHLATSPFFGGILIGLAQAASLLLTSDSLGISASYEHLGRYVWHAFGSTKVSKPASPPLSLIFATGMVAGSFIVSNGASAAAGDADIKLPFFQALAGGFAMIYGSRVAGGCTSGHGLSGMAALSVSSLISAAAMFAAAIAVAQVF